MNRRGNEHRELSNPLQYVTAEALDSEPAPGSVWQQVLLGDCLDSEHPSGQPRCLVSYCDTLGEPRLEWLARFDHVEVHSGDHLVLVHPAECSEPIVAGTVARRQESRDQLSAVCLRQGESLRVVTQRGHVLCEIEESESGPTLKLPPHDVHVELPGALRLSADTISLRSKQGDIDLEATRDVVAKGKFIRLN